MKLFVVEFYGNYAIEVKIIRGESQEEVEKKAKEEITGMPFTEYSIQELFLDGVPGDVFSASYIP